PCAPIRTPPRPIGVSSALLPFEQPRSTFAEVSSMRAPFRPRHLLLACLLLSIPSYAAAWPHDTIGYIPIAPSTGDQVLAQMVSDGAGGSYFVFTDRRSGNEDLYLQRVTATGLIAGGWPAAGLA